MGDLLVVDAPLGFSVSPRLLLKLGQVVGVVRAVVEEEHVLWVMEVLYFEKMFVLDALLSHLLDGLGY